MNGFFVDMCVIEETNNYGAGASAHQIYGCMYVGQATISGQFCLKNMFLFKNESVKQSAVSYILVVYSFIEIGKRTRPI
jgi:hypothetical protein